MLDEILHNNPEKGTSLDFIQTLKRKKQSFSQSEGNSEFSVNSPQTTKNCKKMFFNQNTAEIDDTEDQPIKFVKSGFKEAKPDDEEEDNSIEDTE